MLQLDGRVLAAYTAQPSQHINCSISRSSLDSRKQLQKAIN
ncbi:hypothetical protein SLEP1_g4178 [Rubroshorea leprosula]|uniref:Uncharacterized protein n=1 Tax=Rubroshorea leprosula TaxID=152421 RepID=A0AAV5HNB4_9ROSI|nr:hypothetical protein SLEP1_g4178 [Rubroshorea leprosula]